VEVNEHCGRSCNYVNFSNKGVNEASTVEENMLQLLGTRVKQGSKDSWMWVVFLKKKKKKEKVFQTILSV